MPRFEKTPIQWPAAGLFLIGLYALAGLGYAAYLHSGESIVTWAIVAAIAFVASFVWHNFITRRGTDDGS
jgi:fatty acid desaturase